MEVLPNAEIVLIKLDLHQHLLLHINNCDNMITDQGRQDTKEKFGIMNLKEVGNWWCWTFLAEAFFNHARRCFEGNRKVAWMDGSDIDAEFANNSPSSSPGCSTRPNIEIQWSAFCAISSEERKDSYFEPEVLWIASTAGDTGTCVYVQYSYTRGASSSQGWMKPVWPECHVCLVSNISLLSTGRRTQTRDTRAQLMLETEKIWRIF